MESRAVSSATCAVTQIVATRAFELRFESRERPETSPRGSASTAEVAIKIERTIAIKTVTILPTRDSWIRGGANLKKSERLAGGKDPKGSKDCGLSSFVYATIRLLRNQYDSTGETPSHAIFVWAPDRRDTQNSAG